VPFVLGGSPPEDFARLRSVGFRLLATSSHAHRMLDDGALPARVAWLVGAEGEGLDAAWLSAADELVAIAGSGAVESLNVSAAVAVMLAEHRRQHRA
jgi:TrmH RNA methyltransferase